MKEKVVSFGLEKTLIGITTSPDKKIEQNDYPAIIILNAGFLHRVGPFRLHVDLARKLAHLGFTVLRFDLSGIGDSASQNVSIDYEETVIKDVRDAMDFISAKKANNRFVLMGVCTGADNSHKVAMSDQRVVGIVCCDGYAFPTLRYYIYRHALKLFSPKRILNFLGNLLKGEYNNSIESEEKSVFEWYMPTKKKTKDDLVEMMKRNLKLMYIFTGGVEYYFYEKQFVDCFKTIDFKNNLQVNFFDKADHTYALVSDRIVLISAIADWMENSFRKL